MSTETQTKWRKLGDLVSELGREGGREGGRTRWLVFFFWGVGVVYTCTLVAVCFDWVSLSVYACTHACGWGGRCCVYTHTYIHGWICRCISPTHPHFTPQTQPQAIAKSDFPLAERCAWEADDLSGLLLLFTSLGDATGLSKLAARVGHRGMGCLGCV